MRTYGKRNAASLTVLRRDRRKMHTASSPFPPSPLLFANVLYVYSPAGKNMHCTRNRKRVAKKPPLRAAEIFNILRSNAYFRFIIIQILIGSPFL